LAFLAAFAAILRPRRSSMRWRLRSSRRCLLSAAASPESAPAPADAMLAATLPTVALGSRSSSQSRGLSLGLALPQGPPADCPCCPCCPDRHAIRSLLRPIRAHHSQQRGCLRSERDCAHRVHPPPLRH